MRQAKPDATHAARAAGNMGFKVLYLIVPTYLRKFLYPWILTF
ncbi:hypothetical protein APA_3513 [Pseudanabaena sp. lw0831]|nr:hypothetical protein APA_3513 [Pseudanabaena sp. lw0831]